jgi:hypothetical protein
MIFAQADRGSQQERGRARRAPGVPFALAV